MRVVWCCYCQFPAISSPSSSSSSSLKLPAAVNNNNSTTILTAATRLTSISTATEPKSLLRQRRRLILLRHAESAAPDCFLRDHDRPLSTSGRADAISVSRKLHHIGWIPQLIFSSDATRTKETLEIMKEHAHGISEAKVYFMPSFYSVAAMDGQTADHLQKTICEYSGDEILSVMCMGHNRGWEEAASMFSGASIELKPCNAALLEATGKSWNEAFTLAGLGGWKLHGIVKPNSTL